MNSTRRFLRTLVRVAFVLFLFTVAQLTAAQDHLPKCTVREGKMFIELNKQIRPSLLDSFILQYELGDLYLKEFIRNHSADSLIKQGWKIEVDNRQFLILSKPFIAAYNINNNVDKILFTEKPGSLGARFPAVNNGIVFGVNRFRNKSPFDWQDSIICFYLRNNTKAERVMLAGSFNNWDPDAQPMKKTDSGWIAYVKLGPGKYWYKFIVDGRWTIDNDNLLRENDGLGNVNSVYFRPNIVFALSGFQNEKKVFLTGSFNNWKPGDLLMARTAGGWELPLYLSEGTHTYKFITDGRWIADENNPERLPDGHGSFNSVIRLGKPYLFTLQGFDKARQVVLSGSFNSWREDELFMKRTATGWELPYIIGPGNYEYKFLVDGKWIADPANPLTGSNGNSFLSIRPNYIFRLKGAASAGSVFLAGDFNNWKPDQLAMKREGEEWIFPIHLFAGKVRYKFIVDGKWIIDPNNKQWEQNEYHTGNSVIWIEN